MKKALPLAVLCVMSVTGLALAADISGDHEAPNNEFGKGANYKLTGDAKFGWMTVEIAGDIDLNGHAFVMETGGGNRTTFSGAITGRGSFAWAGGGVPQVGPSTLGGGKPNTFKGALTVIRGVLDLDKPAGVDAVPGDLVVGSGDSASIRLVKPNQINDASNVTLGPKGVCSLELQGNDETFATLTITAHAVIDMGDKPASLVVGNSSGSKWDLTKTVTVRNFKPGKDKLIFGKGANGLTKEQVARVGFESPAGKPAGLYTAKIGSAGQLAPGAVVKAVHPPFDVSNEARAQRAKIYEVKGLADLTGKASPLKDVMTIDFFGDSITWQGGYIGAIDQAVKAGEGSKHKKVKLVNRGVNGGGVLSIRDGSAGGAFPGSSAQKPFAQVIAADKADLAVVYIGVNDVWWRNTAPDVFEKALRDIVASAKANKTPLVLATLSIHGELPNGKNADDPKIEQFAAITRKVAKDTNTVLVDLRKAYVAYLQNNNGQLRVDGTLYLVGSGILTYDGVHPSGKGVALLADMISQGIYEALQKQRRSRQGVVDGGRTD
jgi:lysophospholipase L1-like esterase